MPDLSFYTLEELIDAGELAPREPMAPRHTVQPGGETELGPEVQLPQFMINAGLDRRRDNVIDLNPPSSPDGPEWSPGQLPIWDDEEAPKVYESPGTQEPSIIDMRRNRWKAYLPWLALAGIVFVLWYLSRQ
jgi:hypothetical protein